MEVRATVSSIRVTPRKMSLVASELRGKGINQALGFLRMCRRRRVADVLTTLLKSAVANADQKGTVDVDTLVVKTLLVGKGPSFKRFLTRAKGSASPILKRTCNVTVTLSEQ